MGLYKFVKELAVYGTLTTAALYGLASCETRHYKKNPDVRDTAIKGLDCVEKGLHITQQGLGFLEQKVHEKKEELKEVQQ